MTMKKNVPNAIIIIIDRNYSFKETMENVFARMAITMIYSIVFVKNAKIIGYQYNFFYCNFKVRFVHIMMNLIKLYVRNVLKITQL